MSDSPSTPPEAFPPPLPPPPIPNWKREGSFGTGSGSGGGGGKGGGKCSKSVGVWAWFPCDQTCGICGAGSHCVRSKQNHKHHRCRAHIWW